MPKEPLSLLSKCNEQQQQLDAIFEQLSQELTLSAINRLKAQVLVLSDWLYSLNDDNSDAVLAQAMRYLATYLPHTNQVFCAGIITAKFCHRLNLHGQHARLLISAALTMNISLLLANKSLSNALFKQPKLNAVQAKQIQQYPINSAQLLNKYHIIDKAALHLVINHRELIDGSGFPSQLTGYQLNTNIKILGLITRFIELTSPREYRVGYRIKQALSYLIKHPNKFETSLVNQLISLVDKPLPSFIFKLNKEQYGLINQCNTYSGQLHCRPFSIEDGQLTLDESTQQQNIDYQKQYLTPPAVMTQRIIKQLLSEYVDDPLDDISDQTQRLKPSEDLKLLLNELGTYLPNKDIISQLIDQQPVLGDKLIKHLQSQYPTSKFNSSYHAMQMTGFTQVKPLLSRLALDAQLSHFQFVSAFNLKQKIDCAVAISGHIAASFSHVLPNQLAMFTLLNLAPLYLERHVINSKKTQQNSLENCHSYHGYSLVGLNNSPKQQRISMALAKIWAPRKSTINALSCLVNPELSQAPQEKELVSGFELAIYLTHSIFHNLDLSVLTQDNKLAVICRDLRLTPQALQALQQLALSNNPICEL